MDNLNYDDEISLEQYLIPPPPFQNLNLLRFNALSNAVPSRNTLALTISNFLSKRHQMSEYKRPIKTRHFRVTNCASPQRRCHKPMPSFSPKCPQLIIIIIISDGSGNGLAIRGYPVTRYQMLQQFPRQNILWNNCRGDILNHICNLEY